MGGIQMALLQRLRLTSAAIVIVALSGGGAAAQTASTENGQTVFRVCRACHLVGDNARNAVGPQLNSIVGRPAGSADGYTYSPNLKELGAGGLVWNEQNLDRYLENPKSVVPNGKMVFPGVKDGADRADLVAYLKTLAKP